MHILIVEDDFINRRYIRAVLVHEGHSVVEAMDAMHALEALERDRFDAVLWDIRLPGISGLEAARRVRASGADYADVPMLAVTAYAMKRDCPSLIEAGMDGCLTKPFTPEELLAELDRLDLGAADSEYEANSA